MTYTTEKISTNKAKINFAVDPALFEKGIQKAYRKNVTRINVPGFRKGKAPRQVIEAMYGKNVFYEDAVDEIFPEIYEKAVDEQKLEVVDRPELTAMNVTDEKGLELTVEVYVSPEFDLPQYKGLAISKGATLVTEDDVDAEIERARKNIARYVDVEDRPVKLDDQITLDYAGTVDGVPFEGGTATDARLVIGSGSFIPGFEDQLIGAEIGKEIQVHVTFPEDYHAEELKGKDAVFTCTVKSIQEEDIPALDDEFAKDVSEFDTLAEYRESVRDRLKAEAEKKDTEAFENAILENMTENAVIDIPAAMIDRRIDSRVNTMLSNMRYQGISPDLYFSITNTTMEQLRDSVKDAATNDVKANLIMNKIAQVEAITPTDEDIDAEIQRFADQAQMTLEKAKETLTDDDREYFSSIARWQKTMDFIKSNTVPEVDLPAAETDDSAN